MTKSISVVLPAFNEEASIRGAVDAAVEALDAILDDFEVIVVDDGSSDATARIATELVGENPGRVRALQHRRNRGYGAAIRTGFQAGEKDLLFYTDADSQFDVKELSYFLPLIDEYDVVVGFRVYRYDSVLRSVLSWVYNRIVRILFRVRVRDVDCAFKLFRREVLDAIFIESDDFFVDAELVAKARRWNFRILEKGVRHYPRLAGETTVVPSNIPATLRRIAVMWRNIYMPSRRHLDEVAQLRAAVDPNVVELGQSKTAK
ncbi:hypothetical protein BH10ACT11_BH10ACT11_16750 [soil metagenome]